MGVLARYRIGVYSDSANESLQAPQWRRKMNWTALGFNLFISLSVAWFIARPTGWRQRLELWVLYFFVSIAASAASEGMPVWRSVVIYTLPLAGMAAYTSIVMVQMQRLGKRWNDAPTTYLWWRSDDRVDDGRENGQHRGTQFSPADVGESSE